MRYLAVRHDTPANWLSLFKYADCQAKVFPMRALTVIFCAARLSFSSSLSHSLSPSLQMRRIGSSTRRCRCSMPMWGAVWTSVATLWGNHRRRSPGCITTRASWDSIIASLWPTMERRCSCRYATPASLGTINARLPIRWVCWNVSSNCDRVPSRLGRCVFKSNVSIPMPWSWTCERPEWPMCPMRCKSLATVWRTWARVNSNLTQAIGAMPSSVISPFIAVSRGRRGWKEIERIVLLRFAFHFVELEKFPRQIRNFPEQLIK